MQTTLWEISPNQPGRGSGVGAGWVVAEGWAVLGRVRTGACSVLAAQLGLQLGAGLCQRTPSFPAQLPSLAGVGRPFGDAVGGRAAACVRTTCGSGRQHRRGKSVPCPGFWGTGKHKASGHCCEVAAFPCIRVRPWDFQSVHVSGPAPTRCPLRGIYTSGCGKPMGIWTDIPPASSKDSSGTESAPQGLEVQVLLRGCLVGRGSPDGG